MKGTRLTYWSKWRVPEKHFTPAADESWAASIPCTGHEVCSLVLDKGTGHLLLEACWCTRASKHRTIFFWRGGNFHLFQTTSVGIFHIPNVSSKSVCVEQHLRCRTGREAWWFPSWTMVWLICSVLSKGTVDEDCHLLCWMGFRPARDCQRIYRDVSFNFSS